MSGIPTVVVEIKALTGWADVSHRVLLVEGVKCSRGRSNEFETSSPGTASFTLENSDGECSPANTSSDYYIYGMLNKNVKVRITVAGTQVWQGRIDSIECDPGVAPGGATATFTCTDDFKNFAKARLFPYAVEACLTATTDYSDPAWTAGAVYPLAQPTTGVGSYAAAHRDPAADRIQVRLGSASDLRRFQYTEDGPPHIKSAFKILPVGQVGPVLQHPTTWDPGSQYGLVSLWFRTTANEDSFLWYMDRTSGGTGYASILLNVTTGRLTFTCAGDSGGSVTYTPTSPEDLADGSWHHVAAWFHTGTGTTIRVYIDGALIGTANSGGTACTIGSSNRRAVFGGKRNTAGTDNTYVLNGDIALPAIFTRASTTDAPSYWYDYGITGDADQTVANRLTNLAAFIGVTASATANLSGYQIAGQDIGGRSYLEAVQEIADAEMGVFYVDRLGVARLRGYGARDSAASVTLTLNATQDITSDVRLVSDDATYANTVQATSQAGTVVSQDSALVTADGAELVDNWSTLTFSETNLETMADNRLELRSSQVPRLGRVTVDLLTTPNSIASTTLQLVPLDRVRVSALQAEQFGATTYDGFVEGWELNVSTSQYSVSLDLSPVI